MATYETTDEQETGVVEEVIYEPKSTKSTPTVRSLGNDFAFVIAENPETHTQILLKTRSELVEGVFPVKKGGTGIDSVVGGKLIASNTDGSALEEVDIEVSHFSRLKGNIQDQLDRVRNYTLVVPTTGWELSNGIYSQTFTIKGILESDNPTVGLISTSTDNEQILLEQAAYCCIDVIITNNNSITIYCYNDTPSTEFSININCIGKSAE